jgi:hypothetical protein
MKTNSITNRIANLVALNYSKTKATNIVAGQDFVRKQSLIFKGVWAAMQDAEEMGGPQGQEYIDLMNFIAMEAAERANCFAAYAHGVVESELLCISDLVRRYDLLDDESKGNLDQEIADSIVGVRFSADWQDMSLSRALAINRYCIELIERGDNEYCAVRIIGETNGSTNECGSPVTAVLQTQANGSNIWFDHEATEAEQAALMAFAAFHVYS